MPDETGGMGEPGSPWSRQTVMRMAHNAAMNMAWERGRPARATGLWAPQPSMRLAPHPDGMNIRLFLGGQSPPRPSHRVGLWENPVSPYPCGAGAWGNPVCPYPSPRAYFHVSNFVTYSGFSGFENSHPCP